MLFNREPVLFTSAVRAGVVLATTFGLNLDAGQIGGVMLFTEAVLGLIVRHQVSPTTASAPLVAASPATPA